MRTRTRVLAAAVLGPTALAVLAIGTQGAAQAAVLPATSLGSGLTLPSPSATSGAGSVLSTLSPTVSGVAPAAPGPGVAAGGGSGTLSEQATGPTLTVSPDTGLSNGQKVTVSGSGYSANSAGGMAECNNQPNQPTISVYGNAVPVGCTNPLSSLQATNGSGGFSTSFTVKTGTIGPPAQGTDSAGRSASSDAAEYPCPPTAAQIAAGDTCGISYGDASGHQASANIYFASAGSSSTSTTSGAGSTTSSAPAGGSTADASGSSSTGSSAAKTSTGVSTAASGAGASTSDADSSSDPAGTAGTSSGSLPLTGFSMDLWRLCELGVMLMCLGALLMNAERLRVVTRAVRSSVRRV